MSQKILQMKFDPKTIKHLGVHQYSTLPPVISELVSNSYDAEAESVTINLKDNGSDKEIIISDNGHGMSFEEINDNFLKIGRNRRTDSNSQKSKNDRRFVVGKKGIGKLSFFGIADEIEVTTIQNNVSNTFRMSWPDIEAEGEKGNAYNPVLIGEADMRSEKPQGTTIALRKIKRKTAFSPGDLAHSLSKAFTVFDEPDFKVDIIHNGNDANRINISNSLKFTGVEKLHTWTFPLVLNGITYSYSDKIKGELIATKGTVPASMKGVALFSRGKLVNEHSFYDLKASSFGYDYITGWLDVSFIDNWKKEVISTNRKSLIWEDDDAADLKIYLQQIIPLFYNEQKSKREVVFVKEFKEKTGINLPEWVESLPKSEKKLADKLIKAIFNSELEFDKQRELVGFTQDSFKFKTFQEMADELNDDNYDVAKMVEFFNEWKLIEAKEFYKLSIVRVETIKQFEKLIKEDAREVPVLHEFLKKFSWLLDPRLLNFRDEITYSRLLEEHFPDDATPENDRRIDFLCHKFADSFFYH
jgi:hypothetical protein